MPTINLTAKYIYSLKTPNIRAEYFDEDVPGLCLRITEKGHKSWGLYYRFAGRQQRLGLGNCVALSLKDARKKAADALHDVAHGINPFTAKIETRHCSLWLHVLAVHIPDTAAICSTNSLHTQPNVYIDAILFA